jgi:hypothetical protein
MCPSSREKVGRNDPCPCGSGKKYKHCCLSKEWAEATPSDTPWSRQRDASDRLTPALLKLATREIGDDLLLAWADFNQLPAPKALEEYPDEEAIFSPYMLFDWDPGAPARRRSGKPSAGLVVSLYLDKNMSRLSDLETRIIHQAISQPVSFYEIVRCNPGRSVVMRDVLIGGETEVEEHTASKTMRPGDVVYAQIWKLPEVATLGRLAPRSIPPDRKVDIVELRAKLRRKIAKKNRELSAADLLQYSEQIRTVYLDLRDAMFRPKKLLNTDGEPFVFHTLTFRVGSAQVAFDALASLAWGRTKEELKEGAEWNADGSLQKVKFEWMGKGNRIHKTWDNTILGHLEISGQTLVVEVNSANRAKKIREQIEKRLGIHATHLSTTSRTPEESLAKREKQVKAAPPQFGGAKPLNPELEKQVAARLQEEVKGWIHTKIPALSGRTPLEAVADPDGKEMVEALILGWERVLEGPGFPGQIRPDIDELRRLLNLPVAIGTTIH